MSRKCRRGNTILLVKPTLFLVKCSETKKLIKQPITTKAAYSFHLEFSKFIMPVFYNNFRQLKRLHGLECMCILLFSIRLAIIIFLNIFYSKNSKKSSSSRLGAAAPSFLEDSANYSSTSPLVVSRKRLHDDQKSDLNEII